MREERTAYRVSDQSDYQSHEPRLIAYSVTVTPKRITLHSNSGTYDRDSYFGVDNFTGYAGYRWTPREAWELFLEHNQRDRQAAIDSLAVCDEYIAIAEAALLVIH